MLGVNGTTHVDVVMGQQVDVLFRVGPAAKGEGAVLLAPRPVVRVEVAERSVNHRWHKKDIAVVTQDNLVEISWHQFFYTQKLNYKYINLLCRYKSLKYQIPSLMSPCVGLVMNGLLFLRMVRLKN